jgi:hypothetical protein
MFDDKLALLQSGHSHSCSVPHSDNHRIARLIKVKSSAATKFVESEISKIKHQSFLKGQKKKV